MRKYSMVMMTCLALWGTSSAIAATDNSALFTFAGEYQAIDPRSGEVTPSTLKVIPYKKGMEDESNLTEEQLSLRAWVAENTETKEKVYLDRLDNKDSEMSEALKARGWSCVASSHMMLCGGPSGVQPFNGEDFTSKTGWLAILLHSGPLELVKLWC
ncbi:hypothetical protein [Budvicia aquatica]|uniref:Uncharacterized protein n=1 Tax=Budvicia aquatica TaxID=82979 RepID=A0A484ZNY4_9GAMM|nr:hypothetical protein [Budvicia aquatica]VFS49461.1 Uncharacterised protein [Budvicia aquatica]